MAAAMPPITKSSNPKPDTAGSRQDGPNIVFSSKKFRGIAAPDR